MPWKGQLKREVILMGALYVVLASAFLIVLSIIAPPPWSQHAWNAAVGGFFGGVVSSVTVLAWFAVQYRDERHHNHK